jgi:hypothetical protein
LLCLVLKHSITDTKVFRFTVFEIKIDVLEKSKMIFIEYCTVRKDIQIGCHRQRFEFGRFHQSWIRGFQIERLRQMMADCLWTQSEQSYDVNMNP